MFHLAAFSASITNVADTDIAAVTDDILAIQNNHFILPQPMRLLGAAAMSATLLRAKLASPSMRQIASPFIRPFILAVAPGNNANIWLLDSQNVIVPGQEEIQVQATGGNAMAERFSALAWLQRAASPLPGGNVVPLRFTSTTAAVANAWTTIAVTFADTIPSGWYDIVLSECQSTTAVAHRLIVSNQWERPGHLSFTALSQRLPYAISKGQFGGMGGFRSNDLPRFQVLCTAADAAHEGYLHVVRRGPIQ